MIIGLIGDNDALFKKEINNWLEKTIEQSILCGGALFYHGGFGKFNYSVRTIVWQLKSKYSNIESIVVLPFNDREMIYDNVDKIIYPLSKNIPKFYAIQKRNEWIISKSDVIILGTSNIFGEVQNALNFALETRKKVIVYPNEY